VGQRFKEKHPIEEERETFTMINLEEIKEITQLHPKEHESGPDEEISMLGIHNLEKLSTLRGTFYIQMSLIL
jgi:hypothetical protein